MKKARAMYIPAGGKKAVWGPVDHNVLPEGYPYKEVTVVNEPLNIHIDYDTFVPSVMVNDMLYKVSDVVLTNDEIKKTSVYVENTSGGDNETILLADLWDDSVNEGVVTDEGCTILGGGGTPYLICVRDTAYSLMGIAFPETGLYLAYTHYFRIVDITTTDPVEQRTETIHTMAGEYLPKMIVNVARNEEDGLLTADKTFAEVRAAVNDGFIVEIHINWLGVPGMFTVLRFNGVTGDGFYVFSSGLSTPYSSSDLEGFRLVYGHNEIDGDVLDGNRFTFSVTWG